MNASAEERGEEYVTSEDDVEMLGVGRFEKEGEDLPPPIAGESKLAAMKAEKTK